MANISEFIFDFNRHDQHACAFLALDTAINELEKLAQMLPGGELQAKVLQLREQTKATQLELLFI